MKDQDHWVYIRVKKVRDYMLKAAGGHPKCRAIEIRAPEDVRHHQREHSYMSGAGQYVDIPQGARIISSARVERAVETDDYLRKCDDERLEARRLASGEWRVVPSSYSKHMPMGAGLTLREAYHRYKAKAGQ